MIKYECYNHNPKFKKTTDCVVRALSFATQIKYFDVVDELVEIYKKTGFHIADKKCYEKFLEKHGFIKMKQARKSDNTKYTLREFDKVIKKDELVIVSIAHHLAVVYDHIVMDIWDCRGKVVGNYWVWVKN